MSCLTIDLLMPVPILTCLTTYNFMNSLHQVSYRLTVEDGKTSHALVAGSYKQHRNSPCRTDGDCIEQNNLEKDQA